MCLPFGINKQAGSSREVSQPAGLKVKVRTLAQDKFTALKKANTLRLPKQDQHNKTGHKLYTKIEIFSEE